MGACRRSAWSSLQVGAVCPDCQHTSIVHPGIQNPGLEECVICSLLADQEEIRGWARSISEEMYPLRPVAPPAPDPREQP
jgi:hypothetical protein